MISQTSLRLRYKQTDKPKDKYWIPSTLPTSDLKRTNAISNLNVPVSSSMTRMHSKKAFSAF